MPRDQYTFGHTTQWRQEDNGLGTVMTHAVQLRGTVTMAELIAELGNLDAPDEVYVSNAQIKWDAEASERALLEREGNRRAAIERERYWEIQTLQRLQAKYPEIEASPNAYVEDPLS